jgi:serine/threonine protein kinase
MRGDALGGVGPPAGEAGGYLAAGYRVLAHLHRGRRLDVYEVWSDERDCRCVAKALRADRRSDAKARRALRVEGRLLLELSHPHLVRAYALYERPDPVLILEALGGETLAHMIDRVGRLRISDVCFLGIHLCSAMQYLHRQGYVHLDLKPSNIVSDCGQAKVIDLSIARRHGRSRGGAGTRVYMAPEQCGGLLGPATDVWGIGVVLYEAATGRRPLADHGRSCAHPELERDADPILSKRRLPRALAKTIDGCLVRHPEDRPSVSELAALLESVV